MYDYFPLQNKKSAFFSEFLKLFVNGIILILLSVNIQAQKVNWLKAADRQNNYPFTAYLSGFSSGKNYDESPEDALLQTHLQYAKQKMVESVLVTVNSSVVNQTEISAGKRSTQFQNTVSTNSQIQINGLLTETFYDDRKKTAYAFVYAKKADLLTLYNNQLESQIKKINTLYETGQEFLNKNQQTEALNNLMLTFNHFREIDDIQTILLTIGDLNFDLLRSDEVNALKKKIDVAISGIETSEKENLNDLVAFMTFSLKQQLPELNEEVLLNYFTYEGTKLGSAFSKSLYQNLQNRLINDAGFNVVDPSVQVSRGQQIGYVIKGNYYEEGDYLRVVAAIRNTQNGKALASVEGKISKAWCTMQNISYMPENYMDAMTRLKLFSQGEITNGDLVVDIWTNKGNDNLIFTQGDTLILFVRANKECYLRCVYYLADGSKVLLLDDYYINTDKINKVYQLPYMFRCAAPFGVETLQLNAQTKEFDPINYTMKGGYKFITDDTKTLTQRTRGFIQITDENLKAEKRLTFTTLEY